MEMISTYILVINIIGFFAMGIDKFKAKRNAWRIPEKTFFGIAIIGGSLGAWLGMRIFRHKTKHWYFSLGIPAIFILQIALISYLFG